MVHAKEGDSCTAPDSSNELYDTNNLRCDHTTEKLAARSALGGPCQSAADCKDTLQCTDGACAPGVAAGGACIAQECAQGLTCQQNSAVPNGTCAQGAPLGAPCRYPTDCADGACVLSTSGTLRCARTMLADGKACGGGPR